MSRKQSGILWSGIDEVSVNDRVYGFSGFVQFKESVASVKLWSEMMRKIEAIVREEKMQDVLDALTKADITGITVYQVMGCGTQRGCTGIVRGQEIYTQIRPKIKFEIVVSDEEWEKRAIDAITSAASTGHYGDGKIFAYDLDTVIRIRTGEHGYDAINTSKVEE